MDYVDVMTYNKTFFTIIKMILIYPMMEELFFRRIISEKIYQNNGFYSALWISSIIFAIAHIYSETNILGAFIAGIFLGFIYLKTSNIWLSIFAHALFNALILFSSPTISDLILGITEYWVFGVFIIFSLGLIFIMIYFLNKMGENRRPKRIID